MATTLKTKTTKYKSLTLQELIKRRDHAKERLKLLYLNFRGVKHEDSASEIKDMQIKVLESYIAGLEADIKNYKKR